MKIAPVESGFLAMMNVNADLYNIAPTLSKKPDPQNTDFKIHVETSLSNSSRHADPFPLTGLMSHLRNQKLRLANFYIYVSKYVRNWHLDGSKEIYFQINSFFFTFLHAIIEKNVHILNVYIKTMRNTHCIIFWKIYD